MNAELLKRLIRSHRRNDETGFADAAEQLIVAERRQGHVRLADDLAAALRETPGPARRAREQIATVHELPRSKTEGASLLDTVAPSRGLDDIVLAPETEVRITRFLREFAHRDRLAEHGLPPNRKLLFHGPPGNGKTLCAAVVAGELGLPLHYVRFDSLIASYLGETSANLRRVFDHARHRPGVLFFDEVDAIARSRSDRDDVGELKRVVNSFLQMLDGDASEGPVIAATNHESALDDAIWRRFDDVVWFPMPDEAQLHEYLRRRFRSVRTHGLTVEDAAAKCRGLCLSDVARITTDALKTMVLDGEAALTGALFGAAVDRHQDARSRRRTTP
ncbi:MAG: AAA family ATPase [Deltaproteobacteria bacterium]|nr:AAA family ATPase [Myxococcales bacterium]MDP3217860.1 AAA family ATPase [Deltaproteobacteria bacterium]